MADPREFRRIRFNKIAACPYYYLDVSLNFFRSSPDENDRLRFKKYILDTLRECYGEVGSSTIIDILSYNSEKRRAIIRIESASLIKVRNSLTLTASIESRNCSFTVHKCSPFLISLSVNSRTYKHE